MAAPRVRQGRRGAGGSRCSGWGGALAVSPERRWHFARGLRVTAVVKAPRSRAGQAGDSCALPPWQPRRCPSALIPAGAASMCASITQCQPPCLCHQLCLSPSLCHHCSYVALHGCHHQHWDTPALQTPLSDVAVQVGCHNLHHPTGEGKSVVTNSDQR